MQMGDIVFSERHIQRAIGAALTAHGRYRLGAIALNKRGRIISAVSNRYVTHPTQARYAQLAGQPERVCLHAEMGAIIRARAPIHILLVVRVNRKGELRNAKPCPVCQLAIEEAGIDEVYYSDRHGDIVCLE